MPTLDVEQPQALIDFPQDAGGFIWHHRWLVMPLGGSLWTGVTPDESVQRIDLSLHRVIVLRRNSAFPPAPMPEIYAFDDANFTPALRDRLVAECRDLAAVHGALPAAAVANDATRRVSDTSHFFFGQLVPAAILSDDKLFVSRDSGALVRLDNK